jgi:hypothetical protein
MAYPNKSLFIEKGKTVQIDYISYQILLKLYEQLVTHISEIAIINCNLSQSVTLNIQNTLLFLEVL